MEKLLSVIVPVYNTGKYIRQCIESIRKQSLKNIELLLVDDGSTDGSGKICDEYSCLDGRVRVFHQKNQGPIASRAFGTEKVQGHILPLWILMILWMESLLKWQYPTWKRG